MLTFGQICDDVTAIAFKLRPGYAEKVKADKFRKKMDVWVEGKMKQWDEEEAFRTENKAKHPTRVSYLTFINGKADASFKKQTGQ